MLRTGGPPNLADAEVVSRWVADDAVEALCDDPARLLGIIEFGRTTGVLDGLTAVPRVSLPLAQLGAASLTEVWISSRPVEHGRSECLVYGADGEFMLVACQLPEMAVDRLERVTEHGYSKCLKLARQQGYPHVCRVWNYFSGINQTAAGLERYRRFSLGRYQALESFGYRFDGDLPAASAIGIPGPNRGLLIYLLAQRRAVLSIENPRQISAYRYPVEYGPKSPSFSRAALISLETEQQLYLSGTASIRGHQTVHQGNLSGQLAETLVNIEALLNQPELPSRKSLLQLTKDDQLKVYLRNPDNSPFILRQLAARVSPSCPVMLLHGDICRPDLLLEVEGIVRYPCSS